MSWIIKCFSGIVFIFIGIILAKPVDGFLDFWFKHHIIKDDTKNEK